MLEWWMIVIICMVSATFGYIICGIFAVGRLSDRDNTYSRTISKVTTFTQSTRVERRNVWRNSWKNY